MLKILVVEDTPEKANDIISKIKSLSPDHEITHTQTINETKGTLVSKQFDVMILDIKLPEADEEEILEDGGIRLLKEIKNLKHYTIPKYVVGITGHDDSHKEYQDFFENEFSEVIFYDNTSDAYWKRLEQFLIKVDDIQFRNYNSKMRPFDFDIAIVCALRIPELSSILELPFNWKELKIENDPSNYFTGTFSSNGKMLKIVATSCSQMGMSSAAIASMKMIQHFTPRYLAMTGICAGLKDETKEMGDILIPDVSYDYGSGKYSATETGNTLFINEPQQLRLSAEVKSQFEILMTDDKILNEIRYQAFQKNLCSNLPSKLNIHIGAIGSGSAVISDEKLLKEKKETQTKRLIGIEMEIYGVFQAAHNSIAPRPIPIVMKSICDWGDNKKDDHFQKYASFTSAQVLFEYIKRFVK